ncbi:hypothetical protein [Pseudanabaena sp. Chao 1811]|nr:hypothetical protein [Pseudanabaena sp. Chao 1811]
MSWLKGLFGGKSDGSLIANMSSCFCKFCKVWRRIGMSDVVKYIW